MNIHKFETARHAVGYFPTHLYAAWPCPSNLNLSKYINISTNLKGAKYSPYADYCR